MSGWKKGRRVRRVFHNISHPAECTVAHGGQKKQNVYESRLRYIGWFLVFLLRCTIVFWYEFTVEVLEKQETLSGGLEWSALDLEIAC